MQKGQTQVLILAGIVLVLALAGGIFYLGRATAPKPQNIVATSFPQPSPTPDETVYTESDRSANWKTYTNTRYGFSFKYPPSLEEQQFSVGFSGQTQEFIITLADMKTVVPDSDKPFRGFSVFVEPNIERISFQEYINKEKQIILETYERPFNTEKEVTVDGRKGIVFSGGIWGNDMIYISFPDNKKLLLIGKAEKSAGGFSEILFNQILSTFRFLP